MMKQAVLTRVGVRVGPQTCKNSNHIRGDRSADRMHHRLNKHLPSGQCKRRSVMSCFRTDSPAVTADSHA